MQLSAFAGRASARQTGAHSGGGCVQEEVLQISPAAVNTTVHRDKTVMEAQSVNGAQEHHSAVAATTATTLTAASGADEGQRAGDKADFSVAYEGAVAGALQRVLGAGGDGWTVQEVCGCVVLLQSPTAPTPCNEMSSRRMQESQLEQGPNQCNWEQHA